MKKEEYYRIGSKEGLPYKKCPLIKYCVRRAYTIYFYNDYEELDHLNNIVLTLQKHNELVSDFEEKAIHLEGEPPEWSKSPSILTYSNMCPEVNLFESSALPFAKGTASTAGSFSTDKPSVFRNIENRHFTECNEYSKYIFDNKYDGAKIRSVKKSRTGISQKLRFEIFHRDNFACQYCGKTKDDGAKLELDHKVPVSEGGTDDYQNLTTSCHDCNQGKSNKVI